MCATTCVKIKIDSIYSNWWLIDHLKKIKLWSRSIQYLKKLYDEFLVAQFVLLKPSNEKCVLFLMSQNLQNTKSTQSRAWN